MELLVTRSLSEEQSRNIPTLGRLLGSFIQNGYGSPETEDKPNLIDSKQYGDWSDYIYSRMQL